MPEAENGSGSEGEDGCSSSAGSGSSSSSEEVEPPKRWTRGTALSLVCLGTWLVSIGAVLGVHEATNPSGPMWSPQPVKRMLEAGPLSKPFGQDLCKARKGPFTFQSIPLTAPPARKAALHLLRLTKAKMAECQPPVGLQIGGQPGGSMEQNVRAHWKYSSDCQSVTFRVKIFLPRKGKVWSGQVVFDMQTRQFSLLDDAFDPPLCEIRNEGAGAPSRVPGAATDPDVVESAQFAVAELSYRRLRQGCAGSTTFKLARVVKASQQLSKDVTYLMLIALNVTDSVTGWSKEAEACVTVFERYSEQPPPKSLATGIFGKGNFSVCSDPSTWAACKSLVAPGRALGEADSEASDATNRLVVQRTWRKQVANQTRRLQAQGVKAPISLRHIPDGAVPDNYDLRLLSTTSDCLQKIPVYDQGDCGCCYGAAFAQMFSLRLCMMETSKAARRLSNTTLRGTRRLQETTDCKDDPAWRSPGGHDCAWYGVGLERCYLADVGQLSYCRFSCHTCPSIAVNADPEGAFAHYAYATEDLATCSCNNYDSSSLDVATNCLQSKAGCDGGSMWAVWDGWLRLANRRLRRRDCMPLTIKCLNSAGVTNPLSGGTCASYKKVPLWDRPCSCIPAAEIPSKLPQCALGEDSCSQLPAPDMVYQLMGISHGLSLAETVLNMKRHILEGGPIYVTLMVSQGFMHFWSDGGGLSGNVYTGDDDPDTGGHAVILAGFGLTTGMRPLGVGPGVPFWIFRNSWTAGWGESGYGKIVSGKNVKGIEERSAVAMMGPHADRTPPVCDWQQVTFPYSSYPDQLCRLEMSLTLSCSEEATVQVWFSSALPPETTAEEGMEFAHKDKGSVSVYGSPSLRCADLSSCTISGFDLLYAGYGLKEATLLIKIRSWDRHGNLYSSLSSMPVGSIPGMASVGGQAECGVPEISCEGCTEPAWPVPPKPAPAPPPTPAPPTPYSEAAPSPYPSTSPPTPQPPPLEDGYKLRYKDMPSRRERLQGAKGLRDGWFFCFPPDAQTILADGSPRSLRDLQSGDSLQGGSIPSIFMQDFHEGEDGRFKKLTRYLRVQHALQLQARPLLISANHLVHRAGMHGRETVPAFELRLGDHLLTVAEGLPGHYVESRVLGIDEVVHPGFAAPATSSGTLLVEGVLVSSYALLSEEQLALWRRGPWLLRRYTQDICHFLALPFRLHYRLRSATVGQGSAAPGSAMYLRLLSSAFNLVSSLAGWFL